MTVYTKEKFAKCRTATLALLIKVGFYLAVSLSSPKLTNVGYSDSYSFDDILIGSPKNKGLRCCCRFSNM